MFSKFLAFSEFDQTFFPVKVVFMNSIHEENKYFPGQADLQVNYDRFNDGSLEIMKKINDILFELTSVENPESFCIDLRNLKMDTEKKLASVIRTLIMHSKRTKYFAKAYIINGDARIQELMKQIVDDKKIEVFQYH